LEVFFHFINIFLKFAGIRTFNRCKNPFSPMAKYKFLLFGIAFFILGSVSVYLLQPKPPLASITQNSAITVPYLYEGFVNGTVAVQEITLTKDYLNGVAVRFATKGRENTSNNTLLVLDSNYNILHRENFNSKVIEDTKYHNFPFKESKKVGKGTKVYICFFSTDGDSANCIHALFNNTVKLGDLYASVVFNNDVIRSIPNKIRMYPGSMILRTFESESPLSDIMHFLWYLGVLLVSLFIVFTPQVQDLLRKLVIRAEWVYLLVALVFGLLFVVINPPLQVPDEGSHLVRVAELSSGQFRANGKTIPHSIIYLDSTLLYLHFNPDGKISKDQILALAKVKLNPSVRSESVGVDFTIPYLPQLFGYVIGQLFSSSPLMLMYFGRFFNLLITIVLIFMAIRIAPIGKWIIFAVALMPKALYMMASLSYDAVTIGISFLMIALFLYYTFQAEKIHLKDIALLLGLWLILGLCKPPYFLIGFLFLMIPVQKVKHLSKYMLIVPGALIALAVVFGIWKVAGEIIKSDKSPQTEQVNVSPEPGTPPAHQEINPAKQIQHIKTHLPAFIKLLFATTFDHMRAQMLNNFTGTMGWLDTFLPDPLVNFYLIVLIITALLIAEENIRIDFKRKTLFLVLVVICVVAIETAMYIYSSYVAQERLFGVQGRYFIPIAPLFLLLFYNNVICQKLNFQLNLKRKSYLTAKVNLKPKILQEIDSEQIFMKYIQLFVIVVVVLTLVRAVIAIVTRYYQW